MYIYIYIFDIIDVQMGIKCGLNTLGSYNQEFNYSAPGLSSLKLQLLKVVRNFARKFVSNRVFGAEAGLPTWCLLNLNT